MKPHYDYLIVGSGLAGATFARLATNRGKSCLIIDKRSQVGGNLFCEEISGINVHRYGAHIFHTSDKKVWDFVNKYVELNRFTNSPIADAGDNRLYNMPFNMNTFYQIWGVKTPAEALAKIEKQREDAKRSLIEIGVSSPRNLEEQALILVGKDIYEKLIKGYTEKQWGRPCNELPSFIIKRLPIRLTFDNNYFNDKYQGVPIGGYNKLINNLISGCDVLTNCDFFDHREDLNSMADNIVYTGAIDQFFDYKFGRLEYRSLKFDIKTINMPNYQGNAVVNYTSNCVPYTRIIEHKHFETFGQDIYNNPNTVITTEYPVSFDSNNEPYYPINDDRNLALYRQYEEATNEVANVIFIGRLAQYRYYDMAPLISEVFKLFNL